MASYVPMELITDLINSNLIKSKITKNNAK